jgi:hypothetical protein
MSEEEEEEEEEEAVMLPKKEKKLVELCTVIFVFQKMKLLEVLLHLSVTLPLLC